jgi:secreted trypsin-like serine protease
MAPQAEEDDPVILESAQEALRLAADAPHEFVDVLNERFQAKRPRPRSAEPEEDVDIGLGLFEIAKDPRYTANAATLAQRTLGGQRVLGGKPVVPGSFRDCAAVGGTKRWACSGTLIAPRVVLTAAHCVQCASQVFFGDDVTGVDPRGEHNPAIVQVSDVLRHPDYLRGRNNDLMLLVLAHEVGIQPRKIAPAVAIDDAKDGRVVGFGNTDPGGTKGYGRKQQVDVPIVSQACKGHVDGRDDGLAYGCDAGFEIVAGKPLLRKDSCTGDSGGPFYIQQGTEWLLAGVTSRSTRGAVNTCGDGGIYTRVDRFTDWIASTLKSAGIVWQ